MAENMLIIVALYMHSILNIDASDLECLFSPFPAKVESLTERNPAAAEENEEKETFVAFARVYSGVVKKGQRLFVLGPKYDPAQFLCMVNGSTNPTSDNIFSMQISQS